MRIKWIDTAKGIAMLCVILGHMGGITLAGVNLNLVYAFHLPVFFLLSGYTLKQKELTKEYINDKFKRFMIPYFWTCFGVLIMDIINQILVFDNANIHNITDIVAKDLTRFFFASGTYTTFANVEIGSMIGAIWFLPAMFFATLIVQLVLNKTQNIWMRWTIIISIAMLAYISSEFIWFPFSIQSGAFAALLIFAGYYIREYNVLNRLNWKHYVVFALILVYAVTSNNTRIYYVTNYFPDIIVAMIISLSSTLLVLKVAMLCEKVSYFNYVGTNSIYFLGIHLIALETLKPYFLKIHSWFGVPSEYQKWGIFACHIVFCTIATWCLLYIRKRIAEKAKDKKVENSSRDYTVDIEKGILIAAMLVGHYSIDRNLRDIIYSFHMVAFIFLSGYFYKKKENALKAILHTAKGFLIPYFVFCVLDLLINQPNLSVALNKYLLGMSFSKELFVDTPSIGPVYFVLLLFGVRVIYILIDTYIKQEINKVAITVLISYVGMILGNEGMWLPWSFDCAMYGVVFYMIGHYCRKYGVIKFIKENLVLYFPLASIWVYMIYKGSMEISIRSYNKYGLVILGAVSATILLYLSCTYIYDQLPRWIARIFAWLGENTLYILIVHTVIGKYISAYVSQVFDARYMYHMVANVLLQLLVGTLVGELVRRVTK